VCFVIDQMVVPATAAGQLTMPVRTVVQCIDANICLFWLEHTASGSAVAMLKQ
jgi:hypothetical protein